MTQTPWAMSAPGWQVTPAGRLGFSTIATCQRDLTLAGGNRR
jgi:hypothetical protein